jgi:hypothetical protein
LTDAWTVQNCYSTFVAPALQTQHEPLVVDCLWRGRRRIEMVKGARERFLSSIHRGDACVRHRLVVCSIGGVSKRARTPKSKHIHLSATRSAHFTAFRQILQVLLDGRKEVYTRHGDGDGGTMQRAQKALSSGNGRH